MEKIKIQISNNLKWSFIVVGQQQVKKVALWTCSINWLFAIQKEAIQKLYLFSIEIYWNMADRITHVTYKSSWFIEYLNDIIISSIGSIFICCHKKFKVPNNSM